MHARCTAHISQEEEWELEDEEDGDHDCDADVLCDGIDDGGLKG